MSRIAALLAVLFLSPLRAVADPGKPVAVRWWGQAMVTIETWWGLTVAVDPFSLGTGYPDPAVPADLVVVTHEHADHNNSAIVRGDPRVVHALDQAGRARDLHLILDRQPNAPRPDVSMPMETVVRTPHMVRVRTIPAHHDDAEGAQRGATGLALIEADGVRILHCGDLGQRALTDGQLAQIGAVDVLLVPVGGVYTVDGPAAAAITLQVAPRIVVPIHFKTDALRFDLEGAEGFLESLPDSFERRTVAGNTLAVSAGAGDGRSAVVTLGYLPWEMPDELADLFEAKERAAAEAAAMYATLSAVQLNHRPSNGTHTPRWNAEHTAGTELLLLSRVFAKADAEVRPIEAMPAQMPPDYTPEHPGWTGGEEARRIERTQAFSRRFAYLLEGVGLDERPEGGGWTVRTILERMAWHYPEHADNVREKFELPDWPAE